MPKKADEKKISGAGGRYVEGIGRRKTAVARVRLLGGSGNILINGKNIKEYFSLNSLLGTALAPLNNLKLIDKFDATIKVGGGGIRAQAEAIRHGLARALVLQNPALKKRLRGLGYLTRDPRMVERKKYGLKKARRAPQWQKR
jgi:small subunit ribosomal protein S9